MRWLGSLFSIALAVTLAPSLLPAQTAISAKAGMVNHFQGEVLVNGKALEAGQAKFSQIPEGGVLEATQAGRAELLLSPGVLLWVGEGAKVELVSDDLADAQVRILAGNAILSSTEFPKDIAITVLVNDNTIKIRDTGIYRFESEPAAVFVFEGEADVQRASGELRVKKGRTLALNQPDSELAKFDRESTDALMAWAESRDNYIQLANLSAARQVQTAGLGSFQNSMVGAYRSFGGWFYNPYFGMFTFVPFGQGFSSPFGSYFWTPNTINSAYYNYMSNGGGGFGSVNRRAQSPSMGRSGFGAESSGGFGGYSRGASVWGGRNDGGGRSMSGGGYSGASSSSGGYSGGGATSSGGASMSRGGGASAGGGGRGGAAGRN